MFSRETLADDPPHRREGHLVWVREEHVPADQLLYLVDGFTWKAQLLEGLSGYSGAYYLMPMKGPIPLLIPPAAALGLPTS
jgi:hypothetical protein